jgi:Raf kinase inhibitor-like YbhB/YbcL family protein
MIGKISVGFALGTCVVISPMAVTSAASAAELKVSVDSLKDGGVIADQYRFCVPAAQGHVAPGPDKSPGISWSNGPAGTKSYVITLTDIDNLAEQREKQNKEGMTVPSSAARRTMFHWVLVDIPANVTSLLEGAESEGRVPHGKAQTPAKVGVRGLNAMTDFMAANEQMKGQYYGYDGPCPAWNDELAHRFVFTVYALSVASLNLTGAFNGSAAMAAMKGNVLAQDQVTGVASTNPSVIATMPK